MEHDDKNKEKLVKVFVPNERLGEFWRKIDQLQATARKLDLPEWQVAFGEKEWRSVPVYTKDSSGKIFERKMQLEGTAVSIAGAAPVLNGWRFLAKIEHEADGNLVKGMTGDDLPASWHACGPNCEHCGVARGRNNTFMLMNVNNGEIKQVGSSCLGDFIGGQYRDPERIAAMYDYLMRLGADYEYDPEREISGIGVDSCGIEPSRLMAAVLKIVQEDGGYLSAEKAEGMGCLGTGQRLRAAFWSKRPINVIPDTGHEIKAIEVVSWLEGQKEADSLWLRNIAYLASRQGIDSKNAGLFASGYFAWNRDLERKLKRDSGNAGEWIGNKGEKVIVAATLECHAGYDTSFGYKTVLTFRDETGSGLVWKTQSPPQGLVVGNNYRLLATVKDHGEYRGDRQTEITRTKIAELELFSFGALAGYRKMAAIASPDVVDERGHIPLHKAMWTNEIEHAKVLLAAGANPNQLNQGEIPLLAYATSPEMAKVLIDAGARVADVEDKWLNEMVVSARNTVISAGGRTELDNDAIYDNYDESYSKALTIGSDKQICNPVDPATNQRLEGRVMGRTSKHVVLSIGREAKICDIDDLDRIPEKNENVLIVFAAGRGIVKSMEKAVNNTLSR